MASTSTAPRSRAPGSDVEEKASDFTRTSLVPAELLKGGLVISSHHSTERWLRKRCQVEQNASALFSQALSRMKSPASFLREEES